MTSLQTEPAEQTHDRQDLPIEFRVSRNGTPRRRLTLVGQQYTLGNGPDCSVRLDDPTLLPIHATIERRGDGLLLRAMARPISVNGSSCTQHVLQFGDHFCLGNYDFELVPSVEPPRSKDVPQKQVEEPEKQSTTPRRRVSFAHSLDILQQSTSTPKAVESLVHLLAEDSPAVPSARESQRAILANEKRWQERWLRQQEKHRESQQRSKEQLESLRAAQSNAETRARQSEEIAQALKQQLSELSNKWTTVTNSTVPDLQQQLEKHQRESLASQAENQQLVDSIRSRMDSIQSAIDEVQAETQAIRQHSVFNEEQVRELSEENDQLERALDALAHTQKSFEGETKATTSRLQEELQDASERLLDVASELNENRTQRDALRSAIESLQTTLEQVQLDAQQSEHIQASLATLEAQIESSESRFTELLSYFDSQNVHFQEECESLRQRLELAEQLASEASRVATELLSRNESASHFTAPATTDKSLVHSEPPHIPYSQAEYLYNAATDESGTNQTSEDEPTRREHSANFEPTSDLPLSATEPEHDRNSQRISPANDSQQCSSQDSRQLLHSASDPSDSSDPLEEKQISLDQLSESPGESKTHSQPAASQSHAELLDHEFTPEKFNDEVQANDEVHGFAATMPLTPDLAESISGNYSQIPFDHNPIDPERLADGNESLQPFDDDSSIDDDSSRFVGNSSWPIAPVDGNEVYGSSDFPSHENEHIAHDSIAEEYSEDSLYSDLASSSHSSYSGFAKLDSGIQEDSEEDNSDDGDIVLRGDVIDDKPLYSPPKTRSAAEILAAMGIAVDDDDATSHPEDSSDAQPSNTVLESIASNLADNIGISHDSNGDSSGDAAVDDEESIEDYMNRLLNRVQGTPLPHKNPSLSSQQPPATQSISADSKRTTASIDDIHNSVEKASKIAQGPNTDRERSDSTDTPPHAPLDQPSGQATPRRAAPEKTTNFAALRELANTNARQAIASSARRRLAKEALFKLSIFGVGMMASLATLAGSRFSLDHWMVISVCCFLLSLFFLWEALNLRKRLLTSHPLPEEPKEPTADASETEA